MGSSLEQTVQGGAVALLPIVLDENHRMQPNQTPNRLSSLPTELAV